jgi:hypothetical protein
MIVHLISHLVLLRKIIHIYFSISVIRRTIAKRFTIAHKFWMSQLTSPLVRGPKL